MEETEYEELLQFEMKDERFYNLHEMRSMDVHPTKPWLLTSWGSRYVVIWNYQYQIMSNYVTEVKNFGYFVRCAKFVAQKHWVVAGSDAGFIHVFNYDSFTMHKVVEFKAHYSYVRCVAVHPTLPYILSSSDDMLIKLWDWEKGWVCTRIFEGHSHYVTQVTFNPKDSKIFVSASDDRTIKFWNLGSSNPNFTLDAHKKTVNCVDFCAGGDKLYLISGSDDHTAKVWDYDTKYCVHTLEGHTGNVTTACFHPILPIIITGSKDGKVCIWHSTTYRLENTLNYGIKLGPVSFLKGFPRVAIVCGARFIVVKLGRDIPVASMDNSGNIIWAKHYELQTADVTHVRDDYEVIDGEILPLSVKELGSYYGVYPQYLKHSPRGTYVAVGGDGEYIILSSPQLSYRLLHVEALEFVWSPDGEFALRESTSLIKVFNKYFQKKKSIRPAFSAERIFGGALLAICSSDFICFYDWAKCRLIHCIDFQIKNLYWDRTGDVVAITGKTSYFILKHNHGRVSPCLERKRPIWEQGENDAFVFLFKKNELVTTGVWADNCFVYLNTSWSLKYTICKEVTTLFCFDRPMNLLGSAQDRVFLIDLKFNVIGCTMLINLLKYKTFVRYGQWEKANALIPYIPKKQRDCAARFLEFNGMIGDALHMATDPDYRFELAIQHGSLEIAKKIACDFQSESKWKQLGELAMSTGKFEMAEECMKNTRDFSGLLLLYSSIGDAEGMSRLSNLAQEQGKNNVAFLCLFMLGRLEECLKLLVDSNRIPEAALMARSYLPSKVSEIVGLWRKHLSKINPKKAELLADPQDDPNLFDNWQIALAMESKVAKNC